MLRISTFLSLALRNIVKSQTVWTRVKIKKNSLRSRSPHQSDVLKNLFLELPLNLLALVISRRFPVEVQQGTKIKLRGLEELDLADVDLKIY